MKTYQVKVRETIIQVMEIEADSLEEAQELVVAGEGECVSCEGDIEREIIED